MFDQESGTIELFLHTNPLKCFGARWKQGFTNTEPGKFFFFKDHHAATAPGKHGTGHAAGGAATHDCDVISHFAFYDAEAGRGKPENSGGGKCGMRIAEAENAERGLRIAEGDGAIKITPRRKSAQGRGRYPYLVPQPEDQT